jgi:Na+-translocating ferredoxin:NAD+ oxidoreductase RnfC subunit
MLAYSLLGIEIPSGGLPSEVGLAIFNVATLAEICNLIRSCLPFLDPYVCFLAPRDV